MKFLLKIWRELLLRIDRRRFSVYRSIDFLPAWNFYKVIESGDLRYILKLVDYENLPHTVYFPVEAWDTILAQYFKESFGVKYLKWIGFQRKILILRNQVVFISSAISVLSSFKNDKIITELRNMGIKFDDSSDNSYADSVLALISQLAGYKKHLERKQAEFEREFTVSENRPDIYHTIHALEQFKGFAIDVRVLTVRKLLVYQSEYYKYAMQMRANQPIKHNMQKVR